MNDNSYLVKNVCQPLLYIQRKRKQVVDNLFLRNFYQSISYCLSHNQRPKQ